MGWGSPRWMTRAENAIKWLAHHVGIEVTRYGAHTSTALRLARLFRTHGVDLVVDVGANEGQYASSIRSAGYAGRIVSFEPLGDAHAELTRRARLDPQWTVAPRMALGRSAGQSVIHVSADSQSSSLRAMLPAHANAAPESRYVGTESARVEALDNVVGSQEGSRIFLKLDVQGAESDVLAGATRLLPSVVGLQVEMSLVPLYEDQALFPELLAAIESAGFEVHAFVPVFTDEATGRLLQLDGIFFRAARS